MTKKVARMIFEMVDVVDLLSEGAFETSRNASLETREELDSLLSAKIPKYATEDTSLVVFGSLAREEWTSGSDLDWTYLIDGQANSDHLRIAQAIQGILKENEGRFRSPGSSETFGNMAFSHDLLHQIGGQNDTNKNTTRRILLLLESFPIGMRTEAYDRVMQGVINRYLEEDNHPLTHDGKRYRVPRFLLNDIVRFWRTMAVDFASKQRDRGGKGWGIRNAKLRMSRKLIFASGLLVCFSANLDPDLQSKISTDKSDIRFHLAKHIRELTRLSPLRVIERSVMQYDVPDSVAKDLFEAYAAFLGVLDDKGKRDALDNLRSRDSRTESFKEIREISDVFQRSLDPIFFDNSLVAPLTKKYGVF
ncbi:MAG: nucleotidyltransferase domain-containing protein [Terriglobales bacterium]